MIAKSRFEEKKLLPNLYEIAEIISIYKVFLRVLLQTLQQVKLVRRLIGHFGKITGGNRAAPGQLWSAFMAEIEPAFASMNGLRVASRRPAKQASDDTA